MNKYIYLIILALLLIIAIILFIRRICNKKYKNINNLQKLLFDNYNNNKEYNFYNNFDSDYRIGDFYFLKRKEDIKYIKKILNKYPNSILALYHKKANFNNNQGDILLSILKFKFKPQTILNNSCLLHIRIGDVIDGPNTIYGINGSICNYKCLIKKLYFNYDSYNSNSPSWNKFTTRYIKSLSYFKNKIDICKKYNIKYIYIIAGSHIKLKSYKNSTFYLNTIIDLFKENNIKVFLQLGKTPDEDILFSLNFNYFIKTEGNYSKFIEECLKLFNKNIKIIV